MKQKRLPKLAGMLNRGTKKGNVVITVG